MVLDEMRERTVLAACLAVFVLAGAAAQAAVSAKGGAGQGAPLQTASALLGPTVYGECLAQGRAVRLGRGAPVLLPAHPAAESLRGAIVAEGAAILVETVFVLPRTAPSGDAALAVELASIYGLLRSIGSLEGIEYYSASRKRMRTFYAESYRIDDPKRRARLPDPEPPKAGAVPASESLYALQRDLSFGENVYRYDFESAPGAVRVVATNLTRMSYGIVPVMASEALKTRLFVVQAEDAILFYAASGASAPSLFKGKLEDSFSNRAEALFKWFESKSGAFIAR